MGIWGLGCNLGPTGWGLGTWLPNPGLWTQLHRFVQGTCWENGFLGLSPDLIISGSRAWGTVFLVCLICLWKDGDETLREGTREGGFCAAWRCLQDQDTGGGDEEQGLVCLGLVSVHTDRSGRSCAWRAPVRRGLPDVVHVMGVRP